MARRIIKEKLPPVITGNEITGFDLLNKARPERNRRAIRPKRNEANQNGLAQQGEHYAAGGARAQSRECHVFPVSFGIGVDVARRASARLREWNDPTIYGKTRARHG